MKKEAAKVDLKWTGFCDVFVHGVYAAGFDNRRDAYAYAKYVNRGGTIRPCYISAYEVELLKKCGANY